MRTRTEERQCPCAVAVALRDVAERIERAIERNGRAPAGAFEAWVRERDQLECPCRETAREVSR